MVSLPQQRRYWLGAAALAGVALIAYWPSGDAPPTPTAAPAPRAWDGNIGPGRMAAGPRQSLELSIDDQQAPSAIATNATGQLVVDRPLRMLFEFFLVRGEGADLNARAAQLMAHLDRQVSGPANAQAKTLAAEYVAYVRAYDELLARQRIALQPGAAPNAQQLEQLTVWQQQRARLRHSAFAPALADLWFGADDAALADALTALRARLQPATMTSDSSDGESDSNTLRERRLHGATQAVQDSENAGLLAQATLSYEAATANERQWRDHFLRYRAAAGTIQAGPGTEARRQQLQALQNQIFPTESERIRARASGID